MDDDLRYRWVRPATDEADAVMLAKAQARADGWNPDGPVAYRVVEQTGFLPVAHEWVESA